MQGLNQQKSTTAQSTFTISSDLSEVERAREWISTLAQQSGLSSQENYELQLAVSETCTNAIKHAYAMEKGHTIVLSANIDNSRICLKTRDFGIKLDSDSYQEPNLDKPSESGYGIYILRRLMDELDFDLSHSEGTEVTMVKRRYSDR
jgi:serine/threonine-protein kinase RsbW